MDEVKEDKVPPRRNFLGKLAWLMLGVVAGGTATLAGIAGFGTALRRNGQENVWNTVATLPEIPESKPTRFNVVVTDRAGWLANNTQEAVWVIRKGEQVTAFSAVCPHAGCPVGLEARGFYCSCHGSSWSVTGTRQEGPAPRDMDRLDSRIRENAIEVKYQRFKVGIPQKEPLI